MSNVGIVSAATITNHSRTRDVLTDIGREFIFVDVVEPGGTPTGVWHGQSHDETIRQANVLALEFGGLLRDLTIRKPST